MPYSLEFDKKVDNGDLGSFTGIDGIAEDKRNFLAGEISGSFEKVLKYGLKSDLAKWRVHTLLWTASRHKTSSSPAP